MNPLDEKGLRRPEWREGVAIKLGDGQEWHFPRPRIAFYPARDASGRVETAAERTHGPAYEAQLDRLVECDDGYERAGIQFEMAADLLAVNYDLGPAHLRRLLWLDFGDESSRAMWDAIVGFLMGAEAPKPIPGGSDSP